MRKLYAQEMAQEDIKFYIRGEFDEFDFHDKADTHSDTPKNERMSSGIGMRSRGTALRTLDLNREVQNYSARPEIRTKSTKPRKKWSSVFEEHVDFRNKIDGMRDEANKDDSAGLLETKNREI